MSHFYGRIIGTQKTQATRRGFKTSGLSAMLDGWGSGVRVEARYNEDTEQDEFLVYGTGGSGSNDGYGYIGKITQYKNGRPRFTK